MQLSRSLPLSSGSRSQERGRFQKDRLARHLPSCQSLWKPQLPQKWLARHLPSRHLLQGTLHLLIRLLPSHALHHHPSTATQAPTTADPPPSTDRAA